MRLRQTLLTLAACFGLGLGLAPSVRAAHACSCIDSARWRLELREVIPAAPVDDAAVAAETQRWPEETSFSDHRGPTLWSLGLEVIP